MIGTSMISAKVTSIRDVPPPTIAPNWRSVLLALLGNANDYWSLGSLNNWILCNDTLFRVAQSLLLRLGGALATC
jgi:hypothetical protein